MGFLREDIMKKCPDGFEEELKDFIDEVEVSVNTIKDLMNISGPGDLDSISDAYTGIVTLSEELY